MDFTEHLDEADEMLNLAGVIWVVLYEYYEVLEDNKLAVKCAEAIEAYAKSFPIGNNQVAAICFFETGPEFGAVDLWADADKEEVQ
jgi:hypothetical protein